MAILDGVKIKSAELEEKTKHAFAFVHYLHPTKSRRGKREAIVKMKTIATEKRKAKVKAIKRDSQVAAKKRKAKEKADRKDSQKRRRPRHYHLNLTLNRCTCWRCISVL